MHVKQWNILVELLVFHIALPNPMYDRKEGNLRKPVVAETLEDTEFELDFCYPEIVVFSDIVVQNKLLILFYASVKGVFLLDGQLYNYPE